MWLGVCPGQSERRARRPEARQRGDSSRERLEQAASWQGLTTAIVVAGTTAARRLHPRSRWHATCLSTRDLSHPDRFRICLLYTSDAADERSSVDLGGR